jgi:hypothetical protein
LTLRGQMSEVLYLPCHILIKDANNFVSVPCVLHVPPILYSILSPYYYSLNSTNQKLSLRCCIHPSADPSRRAV